MLTLDLVVLGCTIMNYTEGQMMIVFVAKALQINGLANNYLFNNSCNSLVTKMWLLLLLFLEKAQYEAVIVNKHGEMSILISMLLSSMSVLVE